MNAGTLDMLSDVALADMRADMARLLTDAEIGAVAATYRARSGAHVYDPRSGTVSEAETATAIVCMITPITEREVAGSDVLRRGDVAIQIAAAQIAAAPRVDDRIVTPSTTYTVIEVEQVSMATHYALVGREVS